MPHPDARHAPADPFDSRVLLYGLHDRQIERVVEWYTSREAAERELAVILADEPEWVELLEVVRVDFDGAGVRVERA
jgi:hypothetical protein